jgi:site-specific recombinase XerD
METLAMRIVFDQKGKAKKDPKKKAMIHIEVRDTVTNQKTYIPTNVKILFEHHTKDETIISSKHPNGAILRKNVQSVFNKIEAFVLSDKCEKFEDIQNWDKAADELTTNVVDFIRADLVRRDVSYTTLEYNNSFIKRLEEFERIKTFKDLTYTNIEDFDLHLKKTIKSQPTLYKRHSLFKGYIEKARRRGLIERNPYDDFIFKKGKSEDPVYLVESEVKQIMEYEPKGATKESLERVKDLFLFQCYTGLSYTDLESFGRDKIVIVNNEEQIHGVRNKTGVPYVIFVLPQAKEILDKYDYKLPIISNQKYNEYLGTLIERVGIDKNVTTHTGRHTFGTYLINNGVSIEAIPKIMGHTNMKQSLLYARMLGVTAINEMKTKLLKDTDETDENEEDES